MTEYDGAANAPQRSDPVPSLGTGILNGPRRRFRCGCMSDIGTIGDAGAASIYTIPRSGVPTIPNRHVLDSTTHDSRKG